MKTMTTLAAVAVGLTGFNSTLHADTFGTGANTFTIDFVNIGHAGNANDAGAGGGSFFTPYGGVGYNYRMATYEISQDAITKATASGLVGVVAGAHTGNKPAASVTWYEAAAFVNFLNTSRGHAAAYQLTGVNSLTLWSSAQAWQRDGENLYRHKDAFYFLPSEDEWYKSAYHKNDGVTANYWDYATGSNSAPTAVASGTGAGTAVYNGQPGPADVNLAGGLSAYFTMGQNGNIGEWQESAFTAPNDSSSEDRALRGAFWSFSEANLRSSFRGYDAPAYSNVPVGFRVGSVPEPSTVTLLVGSGFILLLLRRR
jgi:hypothetical protein